MTASPPPHRFGFDTATFTAATAHGGERPIRFVRSRTGTTDTAFNFIDLAIIPPGADVGVHTHAPDNEEIYIIVSGTGVMTVDGRQFPVGSGDVVVNRPGGTHGLRNDGDGELRMVVVELKAGS